MPNECYNRVRIGANKDTIDILSGSTNTTDTWYTDFKKATSSYSETQIEKKGEKGIILHFTTAWRPPYDAFQDLIEKKRDVWLKCDWQEEGGLSGVFVGHWDAEAGTTNIKELHWDDWCIEEYHYRMRVN
jgi:hypothetical protein